VAIVTDTTACIPQGQVRKYNIEVIPIELIFEDKVYRDGIDITPSEFYAMLRQAEKPPTTAGALPGPYLDSFKRASKQGKSILCITEPAKFSGMFNSALVAREMAESALPDTAIEVMECTTAAAGLGLVALAAAKAAASAKDRNEVLEITTSVMSRVNLFATLDTLHYLAKSGRVPQAAALFNSLLQIKPIFALNDSDAHTIALPRSIASAMNRMLKLMEQHVSRVQPLHVAVMHADSPEKAAIFGKRISTRFNCAELFITEFTPVMGVHTGPGLLGVAFYGDD